jgi:hypothetical protein
MQGESAVPAAELLDQQVIGQDGPWRRVRRWWWRGVIPEKGTIIRGLTGWETVEEVGRFVPLHSVAVTEKRAKAA